MSMLEPANASSRPGTRIFDQQPTDGGWGRPTEQVAPHPCGLSTAEDLAGRLYGRFSHLVASVTRNGYRSPQQPTTQFGAEHGHTGRTIPKQDAHRTELVGGQAQPTGATDQRAGRTGCESSWIVACR